MEGGVIDQDRVRLLDVIHGSGLWDGDQIASHSFRPTGTLMTYSPEQAAQLHALGGAINETMKGVGRIVHVAANPVLAAGPTWLMVRKVIGMMVPGFLKPLQSLYPQNIPHLVKVDVMEGTDGMMHIAEIDATNRRGLGYTSVFERIRDVLDPGCSPLGKPVVSALATHVKLLCGKKPPQLGYVYAHQERFYKPEFMILQRELAEHGVELLIGDEHEVEVDGDVVVINGKRCESGLMADFALKLTRTDLMVKFADLYTRAQVRLLIPARPFLGSKALMALIHNAEQNPQLEAILGAFIDRDALTLMRRHIPVTRFVTSSTERPENGVLKEVISSGMKGVYFVSDGDTFDAGFRDARTRPYQYVLQDEIDCKLREMRVLTADGGYSDESLRTRLIVYYIGRELCGGVVTAGVGKSIHGGKEAVFTSSIVR